MNCEREQIRVAGALDRIVGGRVWDLDADEIDAITHTEGCEEKRCDRIADIAHQVKVSTKGAEGFLAAGLAKRALDRWREEAILIK